MTEGTMRSGPGIRLAAVFLTAAILQPGVGAQAPGPASANLPGVPTPATEVRAAARQMDVVPGGEAMLLLAPERLRQLESLRTTDPAELRARWGALADLAGTHWMIDYRSLRNNAGFDIRWVIPGSVLKVGSFWCTEPGKPCAYDEAIAAFRPEPPAKRLFDTVREFDIVRPGGPPTEGYVLMSDGTVVFFGNRGDAERYKFIGATDRAFRTGWEYRRGTEADLPAISVFGVEVEAHRIARAVAAARAAEEKRLQQQERDAALAILQANLARERAAAEAREREAEAVAAARRRDEEAARARVQAEERARAEAEARRLREQQQALQARFPVLKAGEMKTPVLERARRGDLQPAIFYLHENARGRIDVEVTSSSFAPFVAVYEVDRDEPVARSDAERGATARLAADLPRGARHYLVVVHTLDGNVGGYAVKVSQR